VHEELLELIKLHLCTIAMHWMPKLFFSIQQKTLLLLATGLLQSCIDWKISASA